SSTGALPEVVGNPELLFDPRDRRTIADRIVKILRDRDFAADIVRSGREHAAQFTWLRSAEVATNALRQTIERHSSKRSADGLNDLRKRTF
ncbi:hypothetical protein, partial [Klebsiella pneumoniae]|uniref:hypothetical protein n=1 Tax=Klebsiella pneumoniae TaxID=573 RepID=UPI001953D5BD